MIDPRHLVVLREVARTGSLSAAGRALGVSQPAVSQQVRALERRLGTAVAVRTAAGVQLTDAGEVLLRHAGPVLGGLAAAEEEVAAVAGLRVGRARLATFPSGSATLVPPALAELTTRHPGLEVNLTELEPPESVALLREGECDVALSFEFEGDDAARAEEGGRAMVPVGRDPVARDLLTDELLAVLPLGHPLAAGEGTLRLAQLADEPWIAGCPRCRRHLVAACRRSGFEPMVAHATDDYVAVQSLVAAGLGIALLPALVLAASRNPQVIVRRVDPAPRRIVRLLVGPDRARVPAVAALVDALLGAALEYRSRADAVLRGLLEPRVVRLPESTREDVARPA